MGSLKKNAGDESDKNVYRVLEHGKEVLEEYLNTFGFTSMKEVENYLEKPAVTNFNYIPQTVLLEILMVAEKPSTALDIVHRLSLGHFSSSGLGQNKVYYFQGMVFGRHANVWVVSTFGHLTEQSFTEELSCDEDEKALFARVADTSSNSSLSYEFFAKLGRGCDAVILWLDNDHEGEAISFEVIRFLYGYVKVPQGRNPMDAFFRARFSSPSEAFSAIKCLDRPNFKRYMAMVCKHIIDLRVGVAFSRCQKFAAKKILDMYIWKLAYGPCSTACIAMAVDQHLYNLKVIDLLPKFCLEFLVDVDGQKVVILSEPLDEEEAKKRVASLQKFDHCRVVDGPILVKTETVKAPAGINSCDLLQDQSKYFGRHPVATADIAQRLYTKAMTTYSRTETTKHPKDMKLAVWQLRANLAHFMKDDDLGFSPNMDFDEEKAKERSINRGDHPPIMPIGKPLSRYAGNLSKEEIEVYHYICRRFLASSMPDYQYSNKVAMLEMGDGLMLPYHFAQHDVLGFTEVLPEYKVATPGDTVIAKLVPGAEFTYTVSIKEYPHQKFLLEHELIEKMEKYNVGTDGTIPNYIQTMERDGYVKVDPKTRELKPTGLGIKMIEAYRGRECILDMVEAKYREKFIQGIEEIASGKRDFVTFYNESMKDVYAHYKKFAAYLERYIEATKEELKPLVNEKNALDSAIENEKKKAREEAEKKLKLEK